MNTNATKELKLNLAISLLTNLDTNSLEEATDFIGQLLNRQKLGEALSNYLSVEKGCIEEIDFTLSKIETLTESIDRFVLEGDRNFAERDVCSTCGMLLDYTQKIRAQIDELVVRL